MRTFNIRFTIFALVACLAILEAQADTDNLSLGESQYEHGNYQQALSCFDNALKLQPDNATALYYRANTLIKLGLRTQALLDYQQAYKLSTSQTMRDYCSQAMSSLASNTGISAVNHNPSPNNKLAPNQQVQLSQSLGAIQLQSAMDKVRIIDTGELFAQDYTMKQQIKLQEMHRETEQNLQRMREASYYDQYGNKHPLYSALDVQRYGDDRQQQETTIMQSIQKSSQYQTQSSQRRAQLSQESAANLESQLVGNGLPDGIKLDPLGTNLYVRNYDVNASSKSLPKLPAELTTKEKKL